VAVSDHDVKHHCRPPTITQASANGLNWVISVNLTIRSASSAAGKEVAGLDDDPSENANSTKTS